MHMHNDSDVLRLQDVITAVTMQAEALTMSYQCNVNKAPVNRKVLSKNVRALMSFWLDLLFVLNN